MRLLLLVLALLGGATATSVGDPSAEALQLLQAASPTAAHRIEGLGPWKQPYETDLFTDMDRDHDDGHGTSWRRRKSE